MQNFHYGFSPYLGRGHAPKANCDKDNMNYLFGKHLSFPGTYAPNDDIIVATREITDKKVESNLILSITLIRNLQSVKTYKPEKKKTISTNLFIFQALKNKNKLLFHIWACDSFFFNECLPT